MAAAGLDAAGEVKVAKIALTTQLKLYNQLYKQDQNVLQTPKNVLPAPKMPQQPTPYTIERCRYHLGWNEGGGKKRESERER